MTDIFILSLCGENGVWVWVFLEVENLVSGLLIKFLRIFGEVVYLYHI